VYISNDTVVILHCFYWIKQTLIDELSPYLDPSERCHIYVHSEKKIYMTVWFLCNQETFRQMANLFGMPNKGTAHYCIMQVLNAMVANLREKYICWPDNSGQEAIAAAFIDKSG